MHLWSKYAKTELTAPFPTCYGPTMNRTGLAVVGFFFTLLLAILAAIGGIYWQLSEVRERLVRIETQLVYGLPASSDRIVE